MRFLITALLAPILYSLSLALQIVLWVLAWPVVAVLAALKQYETRYQPEFGNTILCFKSKLAFPWDNFEDGIDGTRGYKRAPESWGREFEQQFWIDDTAGWSTWKRIVIWSCWRNPVNNLRFVPVLSFKPRPSKVRVYGRDSKLTFITHGVYSGLRFVVGSSLFHIGWNLRPFDDVTPVGEWDYRLKGCDFVLRRKHLKPKQ